MAEHVLTSASMWMAEIAMQSIVNSCGLSLGADLIDVTTFANTAHKRAAGLKSWGVQMDGFWSASEDALMDAEIAVAGIPVGGVPITLCPTSTGAAGDTAFVGSANIADLKRGGSVGDALAFSAGAQGTGPLAKGYLFTNAAVTSTANSTGIQIGALTASQRLLVAVHVPLVSGSSPTLDVVVQSDDNSGFSSPTTRATLTQLTAAGWRYTTITGAITDDYWRLAYTVGGSGGPSFTTAAAMGRV